MFWNNLYNLCKAKGTTPSSVVKELGLAAGNITKWKNGSIPSKATMELLADYFGVSLAYFFYDPTKDTPLFLQGSLTDNELRLIQAYRAQPQMQDAVNKLLGIDLQDKLYIYTAAHSEDRQLDTVVCMDREEWNKIKNAPQTDDTLL